MKKYTISSLLAFLTLLMLNNSCKTKAKEVELIKSTSLVSFSSASALEYFNHQLFAFGDDAPVLLILNNNHQIKDSLPLFSATQARIPKEVKPDIEAATIINRNGQKVVAGLSSFSTLQRNKLVLFDPSSKKADIFSLKWQNGPIEETNIEGLAVVDQVLILANRANLSYPINYLMLSDFNLADSTIKNTGYIQIEFSDQTGVIGISGLTYSALQDRLYFTASTEITTNAVEDGAIGESYVGYFNQFKNQLGKKSIKPDKLLPLSSLLSQSKPQKIESLAIEQEKKDELLLHLAADNDNGQSMLYKIRWRLNGKD